MSNIDRLLSLLDAEIDRIRTDERSPGWTTWALLAALATLISIFFAEVSENSPSWHSVLAAYLCMQIAIDILRMLMPSKGMESGRRTDPRFELADSTIALVRPSLGFLFIRAVVSLLIYYWLNSAQGYLMWGFISWQSILCLFAIVGFALSAAHLPLPVGVSRAPRGMRIFSGALFLVAGTAFIASVETLWLQHPSPTVVDVHLAAIMSAVVIVVFLLIKRKKSSRMLPVLCEVRRDLVLGRIDYDAAVRQTDIALSGLRVSDVLQEYVVEVLGYIGQLDELLTTLGQEVEALAESESEVGSDVDEKKEAIKRALEQSIDSRLDEAIRISGNASKAGGVFARQSARLAAMAPEADSEIGQLRSKLDRSIERVEQKLGSIRSSVEELGELAEEAG